MKGEAVENAERKENCFNIMKRNQLIEEISVRGRKR